MPTTKNNAILCGNLASDKIVIEFVIFLVDVPETSGRNQPDHLSMIIRVVILVLGQVTIVMQIMKIVPEKMVVLVQCKMIIIMKLNTVLMKM